MATAQLGLCIRHIRDLAADSKKSEQTDGDLLRAFLRANDQAAFETLLVRHGPMVLRVCRRTLANAHDAEDVLQATFLVLARQAASIRKRESLASWLHGVAYRMARNAQRAAARRRGHEAHAKATLPADPALSTALQELQMLLDEEIAALPEVLRAPFILCCLEHKSNAEAARQLGLKEATVGMRLTRARRLLQQRLTRRGVSLTAVLAAVTVGARDAGAAISGSLVGSTARAAVRLVAGGTLTAGLVPAGVANLVKGAKQAMFLGKCKSAILVLLCAGLAVAGLGMAALRGVRAEPPAPARQTSASEEAKKDRPKPAVTEAEKNPGEKVTVHGRVLGPDGKPFAGAQLYLSDSGRERTKFPVRTTSGADGRFEFTFAKTELDRTYSDNPTGQVLAAAKGYGFDVAAVDPSSKNELTLRLVKDVPVTGRILDREGKPVPGARVSVIDVRIFKGEDLKEELANFAKGGFGTEWEKSWYGTIPGQHVSVTTGADGRFRLEGIGRERMASLSVEGPGIHCTPIQVMTRVSKTVVSPNTTYSDRRVYGSRFDHFADPARPIRGVVRDKETGKPVAGVQVSAVFTTHKTKTDKDGRYELLGYLKSKKYHLSATAPDGQPYFTASATFSDTQGLGPLDADIQMVRGIPLRGRVTDKETGKPIRGVSVAYHMLYPNPHAFQGARESSAYTGRDGIFAVVVAQGPGLLALRAEYVPEAKYMSALVTPKEMKAFYKSWSAPGGITEDFLMIAAGGNSARGLIQENYHALVMIEPEAKTEKLTRDVALVPARTLKGTVAGPDGKPLTGVTVFGLTFHHFAQETLKSAHFTVGGINPRRKRSLLFIHKEKGLGYYLEIRGDEKGPLAIKLRPLGSASGRIVDKDGQPVPGLNLNVNRSGLMGPGGVQVKTDEAGRFRAEGLVPGQKYSLSPAPRSLDVRRGGPEIVVESGKDRDLGDVTVESGR
jgi:RNA polymerase sigma factor (sigma-70 family)